MNWFAATNFRDQALSTSMLLLQSYDSKWFAVKIFYMRIKAGLQYAGQVSLHKHVTVSISGFSVFYTYR